MRCKLGNREVSFICIQSAATAAVAAAALCCYTAVVAAAVVLLLPAAVRHRVHRMTKFIDSLLNLIPCVFFLFIQTRISF